LRLRCLRCRGRLGRRRWRRLLFGAASYNVIFFSHNISFLRC